MLDLAELSNWNEYVKLFAGLFARVPPPIIVPVFLILTANRSRAECRQIAAISAITFAATMLIFTFLGEAILNLFGITISAFRIAGGLFLLLLGIDMMRSNISAAVTYEPTNTSLISTSIVPLTIPMLAGPGALSTVIIFANDHEGMTHQIVVGLVCLFIAVLIYIFFRFSSMMAGFFTDTVSSIFNRIMGMIVTAIAVEFILHGLGDHLPNLTISH